MAQNDGYLKYFQIIYEPETHRICFPTAIHPLLKLFFVTNNVSL